MGARRRLVLVSPDSTDAPTLARLRELLPGLVGYVDTVVLRWRGADAKGMAREAAFLREAAPGLDLLLRDRFDVARAAGLAGVQLPEDGCPAAEVRRAWPRALIGVSRHDSHGVEQRSAGADFALVSPLHATVSKPGAGGFGLEGLRECVAASRVPVVALGGITADDVPAVIGAGAQGVAVRSAVFGAADPVGAARRLRAALDAA